MSEAEINIGSDVEPYIVRRGSFVHQGKKIGSPSGRMSDGQTCAKVTHVNSRTRRVDVVKLDPQAPDDWDVHSLTPCPGYEACDTRQKFEKYLA